MLYQHIVKPLLFQLPAETAHQFAAKMTTLGLGRWALQAWSKLQQKDHPRLKTSFCGIEVKNPIGLAAGFDKNASLYPVVHHFGFGFSEVGTSTGEGQVGNPKPRLFRLPKDLALINRMGFNNHGSGSVAQKLARYQRPIPLGGNIGKTKKVDIEHALDDYKKSFGLLAPYVDYFVVNVSSPNTPGLRQLQDKEPLMRLLEALSQANKKKLPILLKIAPDLEDTQLQDIADVVTQTGVRGLIATNTTIARDHLKSSPTKLAEIGNGGLSGAPLRDMSTAVIRRMRQLLPAEIDIIGVGGIFNGRDAYEKIRAGACCVQIYTGFVYGGPRTVFNILEELDQLLADDGFSHISEAVGIDAEAMPDSN